MRSARPGRRRWIWVVLALIVVGLALGLADTWPWNPLSGTVQVTPGGATPGPAGSPRLRVVGLGDSVMAGDNCGCRGIPARYAERLATARETGVDWQNLGEEGITSDDLVSILTDEAAVRAAVARADVVLLTIGANDMYALPDSWACNQQCIDKAASATGGRIAQILSLIRQLRAHQPTRVLVTTYWNVFTDGAVARSSETESELQWDRRVTEATNSAICASLDQRSTCVDLDTPFHDTPTGDPSRYLADDGDHPNADGVELIVTRLLAAG